MSSDVAMKIDGLGKQYRVGVGDADGMYKYNSLRDSFGRLARRPWSVITDRRKLTDDNSFWALKNVSFEVKRGEVVGIIGRNGAGKSTLLKVLSQITKPTTGEIAVRGRVGSLLEVGTGFHPELSGRENVYLNGAILGMTRGEVKAKFDEIVAFSEIERFLDTPVKQYSSGMYTRLAFAVAAHLEPEVLVVDEVLAVGDAAFQKKCLGKMKDAAGQGQTVLFVSHNMAAIRTLCTRAITLAKGQSTVEHSIEGAITSYLASTAPDGETAAWRRTTSKANIIRSCLPDKAVYGATEPKNIDIKLVPDAKFRIPFDVIVEIVDFSGNVVTNMASRFHSQLSPAARSSRVRFTISTPWLAPGTYSVTVRLVHHSIYDTVEDACRIIIEEAYPYAGMTSLSELEGRRWIPGFTCSVS